MAPMRKNIYDVRQDNLRALIARRFAGNQSAFAAHVGIEQPSYVSRLLSHNKTIRKNLGDDLARTLEKKCGLEKHLLDDPVTAEIFGIASDRQARGNLVPFHPAGGRVPLLEWDQLATWRPDGDDKGVPWMSTDSVLDGNNGFAVRVTDDSMVSADLEHSFPRDTVIVVRRSAKANSQQFVVAKLTRKGPATFKQYVEDSGRRYLVPLNGRYPTLELTKESKILGVVVESQYRRLLT